MIDEVKVNGIDVTDYRLRWYNEAEIGVAIDLLEIEFNKNITSVSNPVVGSSITIRRGFDSVEEDFVFEGIITQRNPITTKISVVAKSQLIEAIKSRQTKSWEYDIDTEAGVGSEIFKSHCDNAGLYYDDDSIVSTGTGTGNIIIKWIQNDEDDLAKMNELKDLFDYSIKYIPRNTGTGRVFFQPKGFETYPATLNVGTEIPGQIEWSENMEKMFNKVIIQGATVYDKIVETGTGPTLTLSKTPEDTEVRLTDASGAVKTRGQKDLGVLGTDFDYYVDAEQKKVVLTDSSTYWIRYGAQVPMPVILTNVTSVDNYGGPNKTPTSKKFFFNDIKDIADAEARGRSKLSKFSTPFNEAENIPISNSTLQTHGFVKAGDLIPIVDSYNDKSVSVVAKIVKKSYPHVYDLVVVGDEIWRTTDWESNITEKITQLFNELNKNQDILIEVTDLNKDVIFENRYFKKQSRSIVGTGGIWNHPDYGTWGTMFWTDGSELPDYTDDVIMQGNDTYRELFYDEDFLDSDNTTADWNTGSGQLIFTDSTQEAYSTEIVKNQRLITQARITATGSGIANSDLFMRTGTGNDWEDAPNGTTHTFTTTGSGIEYKIKAIPLDYSNMTTGSGDTVTTGSGDTIVLASATGSGGAVIITNIVIDKY